MKRANGTGNIVKLNGNRRKPYGVRLYSHTEVDEVNQKATKKYKYLGYYRTYSEAEAALSDYLKEPYRIDSITLEELHDKWLEKYKKHVTPSTVRTRESDWNALKDLYNVPIAQLSRRNIQECMDSLDLSDVMKYRKKILLGLLIDYAIQYELLPESRANMLDYVDFKGSKPVKKLERNIFTQKEIEILYDNIDNDICRTLLVYIYTGMRWSELANLKEENFHEEEHYVTIVKAKTKAGYRDVPLSDRVMKLLPIAPQTTYGNFVSKFEAVMKHFGWNHTIHDCRHTFITMLTEKGVDHRLISQIVGHVANNTAERFYTHYSIEEKLKAVNLL